MGGKLNVYNLGELGVNVTKSPIHHADGEMLSCQNAEFNAESGVGGIRKRAGLQRLNSSVLAGTVKGVIGVPMQGPGKRQIYAQRPGSPWFRVSTDGGTTWGDAAFNSSPQSVGILFSDYPMLRSALISGRFFYTIRDTDTSGCVMGFDGSLEYQLYRSLAGNNVRMLCSHSGLIIFADGNRVFSMDPTTGATTQVAADFASNQEPYCGVSFLGRIWIGIATLTESFGKIYSAALGDTAWTLERQAAANHRYASMAVYRGELYAGTSVIAAGTAAIVEKRTVGGTWSTSRTGGQVIRNAYDGLVVADDKLYAAYHDGNGSVTFCAIEVYNGAAWSTSLDLQAQGELGLSGTTAAGATVFYNSFTAGHNKVWRRVSAGAWAGVDTTAGTPTYGVMGVL